MLIRHLAFRLSHPVLLAAAVVGLTTWPCLANVSVHSGPALPAHAASPITSRPGMFNHRSRWIGVVVQAIPPVFSHLLGLKAHQGLLIMQVVPGSPAQQAKLRAGDLLIDINGAPLLTERQLVAAVNKRVAVPTPKKSPIKSPALKSPACRLVLIRNGHTRSVTVRPSPRPAHLMMLPDGRLFIAAHQPDAELNGALPKPTGGVGFGPGVVIHLDPAGPGASGTKPWTHAVMVRQWIDRLGVRHILLIFQGRSYALHAQHIASLPAQIQPLARLIVERNRRLEASLTPAHIAAYIAQIQQQMKMLHDQQTILARQIRWLRRHSTTPPTNPATRP